MTESTTLVLVCKRPALGMGKQRLAAHLGTEITLRVAEALLACALEDACNWPGQVVIAPASQHDHDWAVNLSLSVQSPVIVLSQITGNLGQRLNRLDHELRQRRMEQLVYIGSDAPGLKVSDYMAVNAALSHHDTVLMPSTDGGVVLMASHCPWPELSGLPWSTDQLGTALADSCCIAGHSVATLREGCDIDELGDLVKLTTQLEKDRRPARRALYQLTRHVVTTMSTANAKF